MVRTNVAGVNRCGAFLCLLCGVLAPAPGVAANKTGSSPAGLPPADLLASDGGAGLNSSADSSVKSAAPRFDFDIPAQSLVAALDQFGLVSRRSALFRSALAAGLVSSPVHGRYTPVAALHLLLAGTGLDVKEVSAGGVVALVLIPAGPGVPATAAATSSADKTDRYDGLIQTRVWDAICANPSTAAADYRSLLRFGVDANGRISRARLVSSTGDRRRDAALLDILQHVRIDQAPPADLAQPLTMLILPGQDGGPVCHGDAP